MSLDQFLININFHYLLMIEENSIKKELLTILKDIVHKIDEYVEIDNIYTSTKHLTQAITQRFKD